MLRSEMLVQQNTLNINQIGKEIMSKAKSIVKTQTKAYDELKILA